MLPKGNVSQAVESLIQKGFLMRLPDTKYQKRDDNSKFQYRFQYQLFFSCLNIAGFSFCSFHFFVPFLTRIFSSLLESHCAEAALLPPLLPSSPSRTQTVLCPLVHQEAPVLRPLPVLPSPQPSFDFFLFVRQFQKNSVSTGPGQTAVTKISSSQSSVRRLLEKLST